MKAKWLILTAALVLIALMCAACGNNKAGDGSPASDEETATVTNKTSEASQDEETEKNTEASGQAVDESKANPDHITAVIDVEDYGKITVDLDPTAAPVTVKNFVKLAKDGFYDGLTFHRIMNGFMIQGGDPLGNGTGGSDETIKGEFSENGVNNPISHKRGTISMARSQDPDSASSQFFIVQADSLFLDGQYAAFGTVTDGMKIVDQICEDALPTDDNGTIPPDEQPVIRSVTIKE